MVETTISPLIAYGVPGLLGMFIGLSLGAVRRQRVIRLAHQKAEQIVMAAEEREEELLDEEKQKIEDLRADLEERIELDESAFEERKMEAQRRMQSKRARFDDSFQGRFRAYQSKSSQLGNFEQHVIEKQNRLRSLAQKMEESRLQLIQKWGERSDEKIEQIKSRLAEEVERATTIQVSNWAKQAEEKLTKDAEKAAKRVINIALNRFARPYCAERGIGYVVLANEDQKKRLFGKDRENLMHVEQFCGVDIVYNEEYQSLAVSGFDPVRRELARASLEKLLHEKNVTKDRINAIVTKTKRDLFRKIRQDGKRAVQDLRLPYLHPEILNMMGALRYRYSFAQNQYFHCGEVGFLCGLLSAELGLPVVDGRRAGLLHDIGKAMDHSQDGGHAVIGADFISKYEEPIHIVHAVRAHHYDEAPNSELAFLVIAADALSGARPGARRSTADSYMQKMGQLEEIGASFEGVQSTFILSAGREVRIYVDSHRVDDQAALDLSKNIARKIEDEVNYPGFIKVTVVRQTQAVQVAK